LFVFRVSNLRFIFQILARERRVELRISEEWRDLFLTERTWRSILPRLLVWSAADSGFFNLFHDQLFAVSRFTGSGGNKSKSGDALCVTGMLLISAARVKLTGFIVQQAENAGITAVFPPFEQVIPAAE